jgi:hypothetical protein
MLERGPSAICGVGPCLKSSAKSHELATLPLPVAHSRIHCTGSANKPEAFLMSYAAQLSDCISNPA